jgi:hypothetical protein
VFGSLILVVPITPSAALDVQVLGAASNRNYLAALSAIILESGRVKEYGSHR